MEIGWIIQRIEERISDASMIGAHNQYIEGMREALDIIRDEME